MIPNTEIYSVKFNKYRLENGDVGFSAYTLGVVYIVGMVKIVPKKIKLIKDRVHVWFEDSGKHVFGYNDDVELFYRPVKEEEIKTEDNEDKD
jgi:hypothetical protein